MKRTTDPVDDPEIAAISKVYAALKELEPDAQSRVLAYVAGKLKVAAPIASEHGRVEDSSPAEKEHSVSNSEKGSELKEEHSDLDGISAIARKWMTRTGLSSAQLQKVFSLGLDEIDLIATSVPGKGRREKMRSVFLLKGIAAYLGTGVARFSHEQMKSTCLHYDAFDATNFAANLRGLSSEVTGGKSEGYTLTARGLAAGTDMVKDLTQAAGAG